MYYAQISPTAATAFDDEDAYNAAIAAGATSMTLDEYVTFSLTPVITPAMAQAALVVAAQAQLDTVTGPRGQLARCQIVGIAFPENWQAYVLALRNIVNGTDTTSTSLPTQPAYVQGT